MIHIECVSNVEFLIIVWQAKNAHIVERNILSEQFIGRGEKLVKKILDNPWGITGVNAQVNITKLIPASALKDYDQEILNHNFDFLALRRNLKHIVIEVNYKHGDKAAKKWTNIFVPLLKQFDYDIMTVDDYECVNLFKEHNKPTYLDIIDMVMAFKKAKIKIG